MDRFFNDDGRTVGEGTWVVLDRETRETVFVAAPWYGTETAEAMTAEIADGLNRGYLSTEEVAKTSWSPSGDHPHAV